jgi:hypothetical protein
MRPNFERRPLRVVGIPVARAIFRFALVTPIARFHENDNPGASFIPCPHLLNSHQPSAASGNVCALDELAEGSVVGVAVAPDDIAADHARLGVVGGVVGAVECEVAQCLELGFDPVQP